MWRGRSSGCWMRELPHSLCVEIDLPLRLGIGRIDLYRTNPDGVPSEPSAARPARVARTPLAWHETFDAVSHTQQDAALQH
jgi:hypothetical protein